MGLVKASIQPEEIKLIVLTHGHWDHIGSAREIKQLTGANVLLHQKDVHFVVDAKPIQPPGLLLGGRL